MTTQSQSRAIRLIREGTTFVVHRASPDHRDFSPFPLPPLTASQSLWLVTLCERFHTICGRAICATLMLDPVRQRWDHPQIPTQRCHADGASWHLRWADYADRPRHLAVAGSFQLARNVSTIDEVLARVPAHLDGLHVVQVLTADNHWVGHLAVTAGGSVQSVAAADFVTDDWLATFSENKHRLELLK